jgi:hypothetical protein
MQMKYFASVAISFALVALLLADSKKAESLSVKQLIERLGSNSFEEREEASRLLVDREEAVLELRAALKFPDAEVRRRAREILAEMEYRPATRGLDKAAFLLESGEVDQAVERLVHWADADPAGKSLEPLVRFAQKVFEREQKQFGKLEPKFFNFANAPIGDLAKYVKSNQPLFLQSRQRLQVPVKKADRNVFVVRGCGVTVPALWTSLIVSSNDVVVKHDECVYGTVIFAAGSVSFEPKADLETTVIVSAGDVTVKDPDCPVGFGDCLIVARGNVTLSREGLIRCAIFAGGTVKAPPGACFAWCVIREHEPNALGLVNFFDPAKAGIEVGPSKDGVEVKTVGKDTVFDASGLKPGDVLTAISGKPIESPETFRRLLRTALAEGVPFTIVARRAEKALELVVKTRD